MIRVRPARLQQALPRHAVSSPSEKPPAVEGASVFIDAFHDSQAHGTKVETAAREMGDLGPVVRYCQRQAGGGTLPYTANLKALTEQFRSGPLTEAEANRALDRFLTSAASDYLDFMTGILTEVNADHYTRSTANLSQGFDELTLFQLVGHPLRQLGESSSYAQNLALCLQQERQEADLPQLPHPAMARDQLLLRRIGKTLRHSAEVQQAQERWRDAVRTFESGHNSVVVAAGNSGQHLQQLARLGFQLDENLDVNLLAVPEVTTVGASANTAQGESLSPTSSFGPEVDLLAEGSSGGNFGTSYAAPKVANVMRALHLRWPDMSSDEVEQVVREQLCAASGPIAILDRDQARDAVGGKF